MPAALSFLGDVRVSSVPAYASGDNKAQINRRGETLVAQGLPFKTELARLGNSWNCTIPTGSAFTPVAAMPTTRSELALYNGYSDGTCLVIDSVWVYSLTSLAAASGFTLIYQVASVAVLTDNTAVLINSPTGKTYSGSVLRALATTTMTANKWAALNSSGGISTTTTIGSGLFAEVAGGVIVKPGFTLGLNAVMSTAAGTALIGVAWHEAKLDYN